MLTAILTLINELPGAGENITSACWYPNTRVSGMAKPVTMILMLLTTSAAADDYRSYREAYAGVVWPNSITSAVQCQQRVTDVVRQFGFTDSEVGTSQWTAEPDLRVQDQAHHYRIAFSCDPRKRIVTIDIAGEQNQTGSAGNLLDRLISSFTAR